MQNLWEHHWEPRTHHMALPKPWKQMGGVEEMFLKITWKNLTNAVGKTERLTLVWPAWAEAKIRTIQTPRIIIINMKKKKQKSNNEKTHGNDKKEYEDEATS